MWGRGADPTPPFPHLYDPRPPSQAERTVDGATPNAHPTVKSLALMRHLCRLVTPPGGAILDMFAGTGSTGAAAVPEGYSFVGIENDPDSAGVARVRVGKAVKGSGDGVTGEETATHAGGPLCRVSRGGGGIRAPGR